MPGDIVACHGTDWSSRVIRWVTAAPRGPCGLWLGPSHVAIISASDRGLLWVESTTQCLHPCEIQGRMVSGCQAHDPELRLQDYLAMGGYVDLYRLDPIHRLDGNEQLLLRDLLFRRLLAKGVEYDLKGALLSGTRLLRWLGLLPRANLQTLFCSELIAAVLMRLNRMNHANPSGYSPARLLRTLVALGKYERIVRWPAAPDMDRGSDDYLAALPGSCPAAVPHVAVGSAAGSQPASPDASGSELHLL
ncbi:MAG: hypothetical protein DWH91_03095 [Planctomycetota bacterium]|nr:MAG: hypothetical protein DWH91_03095 [Planctomycetota bacterium]